MKKNMNTLAIGALLFFGIVWVGTMVIPADAGMLFIMALLFVANPIYFVLTGITGGKNPVQSWFVPILAALIFTISYSIILDMKELIYPVIYLILAYVTMLLTWIVKKARQKH